MATLYIVDQSLRDEGSHHADYVQCIASVAKKAGYQVVIGANQQLPLKSTRSSPGLNGLKDVSSIRAIFKNTTYQKCSELAGLQKMKRLRRKSQVISNIAPTKLKSSTGIAKKSNFSLSNLVEKYYLYRLKKNQDSIIRQFSRDCSRFFQATNFTASDHIFFASISDLELIGLADYLARTPPTLRAQWHAQFHFNLLEGRPPEYEQQSEVLQSVRARLRAALDPLVYHNLNLYTTTDELTEQFNQLGVGHFQTLAYPIATEFAPSTIVQSASGDLGNRTAARTRADAVSSSPTNLNDAIKIAGSCRDDANHQQSEFANRANEFRRRDFPNQSPFEFDHELFLIKKPLRVVCPGAIRREKGQGEYLPALIQEIHSSSMDSKRIRWVVQQPEKKIGERPKLALPKSLTSAESTFEDIEITPHPLPRSEYIQLIRNADIGLLYYDSESYYSRRAGILGELLAVGKPVIVPAGCWLAEQVAEPIFCHAEKWFADRQHRKLGLADLRWEIANAPMHGGIINFDNARRPFRFETELSSGDTAVGLCFDWRWPSESGVYCRAEWEQLDESGNVIAQGCQVLGHRLQRHRNQASCKTIALIPIQSGTSRIKFCLKNAFHSSSASLRSIELLITNSNEIGEEPIPLGAVGVIVPDRESLSTSLLEVVTHYEHYRDSANKFSREWFEQHHPARTLSQLTAPDQLAAEVA